MSDPEKSGGAAQSPAPSPEPVETSRAVPAAMVLFAAVGSVAPYTARPLGFYIQVARPAIEIVDHVVPGIVIILAAGFALAKGRMTLIPAMVAALAGLWMTSTHVPLFPQVNQGLVSLGAALWHSVPGFTLLALGVAATARAWKEEPSE